MGPASFSQWNGSSSLEKGDGGRFAFPWSSLGQSIQTGLDTELTNLNLSLKRKRGRGSFRFPLVLAWSVDLDWAGRRAHKPQPFFGIAPDVSSFYFPGE